MYPRIPWEPVVDPLESTEHILWTSGLQRTSAHFLNEVSTFHLYFALAHRNSERKSLECTYMSISVEEGNSYCEYSVIVCKQHWVLWFVVCVWRVPAFNWTDSWCWLWRESYWASISSLPDRLCWRSLCICTIEPRDGDHGGYGIGCTPEESYFCSWQHRKIFLFSIILDRLWNQSVCCWLHSGVKGGSSWDRPTICKNVDLQVQWSARMVKTFHICHFAITADYGWCSAHISMATFQS